MAFNRIILWLGYSLLLLAALMALTALSALAFVEFDQAVRFGGLAFSTSIAGFVFVFTTWKMPNLETGFDALTFLLVFWLFVPIVTAIPFLISNQSGGIIGAYFESVSAFTTTGASGFDADTLSRPMHIWRSLLQWAGGVMSATLAVVVLAALNLRGTGVHRSMLFTFKRGELFSHLAATTRTVAIIYAIISGLCFLCLLLSATPIFEAACLALSSVSTGGLMPRNGGLNSYVNHLGLFALCLTCVLGAMNVSVLWDAFRTMSWVRWKEIFRNVEHRALLVLIVLLFIVGMIATSGQQMKTVLVEAVFFVSSTGFDYDVIGLELAPPVILICIALIGGSALSTAGGIKIIRLLLLLRHAGTDLSRLSHPSRIVPVMFRKNVLPDAAFLSVWMYFFGYTLLFGLGIVCFGALGQDFVMATYTSAASLSNMGPLLDYTLPDFTYASFTDGQKLMAAFLMLAGRVEVLAILGILVPGIWRS